MSQNTHHYKCYVCGVQDMWDLGILDKIKNTPPLKLSFVLFIDEDDVSIESVSIYLKFRMIIKSGI